jgi:HNH endonuclease
MADNGRVLLIRFNQAMLETYDAAMRLKPPYRPTEFRRMVTELGGKETADRLLAARTPSSGFTELFQRGRENLKLSVEYLVLQHPWRSLFTPEQLNVARKRLRDVECELPPDDVPAPVESSLLTTAAGDEQFPEGTAYEVIVNQYERNPAARARCIEHHGAQCSVCGLDFGITYGPAAKGYIHVHHLLPLSQIKSTYEVDPMRDLRPVCPNCHAVLHLGGQTRSIEEVQRMLRRARTSE